MQVPTTTEAVENIEKLGSAWKKNPWGITIFLVIAAFIGGNYMGSRGSIGEIERLNKNNEKLQSELNYIARASLQKNGIIYDKVQKIQEKEMENDTLKQTLIQVGDVLMEAKQPAVKILNK